MIVGLRVGARIRSNDDARSQERPLGAGELQPNSRELHKSRPDHSAPSDHRRGSANERATVLRKHQIGSSTPKQTARTRAPKVESPSMAEPVAAEHQESRQQRREAASSLLAVAPEDRRQQQQQQQHQQQQRQPQRLDYCRKNNNNFQSGLLKRLKREESGDLMRSELQERGELPTIIKQHISPEETESNPNSDESCDENEADRETKRKMIDLIDENGNNKTFGSANSNGKPTTSGELIDDDELEENGFVLLQDELVNRVKSKGGNDCTIDSAFRSNDAGIINQNNINSNNNINNNINININDSLVNDLAPMDEDDVEDEDDDEEDDDENDEDDEDNDDVEQGFRFGRDQQQQREQNLDLEMHFQLDYQQQQIQQTNNKQENEQPNGQQQQTIAKQLLRLERQVELIKRNSRENEQRLISVQSLNQEILSKVGAIERVIEALSGIGSGLGQIDLSSLGNSNSSASALASAFAAAAAAATSTERQNRSESEAQNSNSQLLEHLGHAHNTRNHTNLSQHNQQQLQQLNQTTTGWSGVSQSSTSGGTQQLRSSSPQLPVLGSSGHNGATSGLNLATVGSQHQTGIQQEQQHQHQHQHQHQQQQQHQHQQSLNLLHQSQSQNGEPINVDTCSSSQIQQQLANVGHHHQTVAGSATGVIRGLSLSSRHSSASVSPSLGANSSRLSVSPVNSQSGVLAAQVAAQLAAANQHGPPSHSMSSLQTGSGPNSASGDPQSLAAMMAASQFLSAALGQLGDLDQIAQQRLLASTLGAAAATEAAKTGAEPPGNPLGGHSNQLQASTGSNQLARQLAAAAAAASGGNQGMAAAAAMAAQLAAAAAANQNNHLHQQQPGQQSQQTPTSNNRRPLPMGLNGERRSSGATPTAVHSIPHPHSHHALSHPASAAAASLLISSPHYHTVRTKYSTRRYSRRRVGPDEAMADPAIRSTVNLKMPTVPKTILIVLKHRLTVQTAITLACAQTGDRLRKGAIQKKLEAMFREPGAVEQFLAEWDHQK